MLVRSLALVLALSTALAETSADASFDATASCERRASKGRVLCDVELEAPGGRIAWADVLVTAAPAFAPPLRSRVGLGDARTRTDHRVRLPVAFVATALGRGSVVMRARAVVCHATTSAAESCVPATRDVSAEIVVGTDVEP